jgi:gamma-carbonic anhydrase
MPILTSFESATPRVAAGVFVAPGAVIVGDVEIGVGSSVWYGTVIRADGESVYVGARTNIQDLSVIHITSGVQGTWIGDEVTIGHRAIVHAATVRSRSLIGMGAIVLDGAIVGENCLIGAGALVAPGKRIPPGSVVLGNPGRVVRRLRDEEIENIHSSAQHYEDLARRHRAIFESGQ